MSNAVADLVLTGNIYTGDAAAPWVQAIGVRDGVITSAGTLAEVVAHSPEAERVELGGAAVVPGLIDVHNHHAVAGRAELFELAVAPTDGLDAILAAVRERAEQTGPGGWIVGGSWGSTLPNVLNRADSLARLDAASAGHPVVLVDDSHHNRWANSAALDLAGWPAAGAPGVLTDPVTGGLTGVLLEAAGKEVAQAYERIAPLSPEHHEAASRRGIEVLNAFGVTAFQDAAADLPTLTALRSLDERGELNAWVVSSLLMNDEIFGADPIGPDLIRQATRFATAHHRPTFVKIFLDGVPPARTGGFLEPYLPDETHGSAHAGHTTVPIEELTDWLVAAAELGLSVSCVLVTSRASMP